MVDTTNFQKYFEDRAKLQEQVVQYCADHPEETYKSIGARFGVTPAGVRYYAFKAGMIRVRGVRHGQKTRPVKLVE